MNAIAGISDALGYDAAESMLASGASLASVLAFAAAAAESLPLPSDAAPESAATVLAIDAATVAPRKAA